MKYVLFLFIAAFLFISCSSDDDGPINELNRNRNLWEASKISNYHWTENVGCFCIGILDVEIFVVDGVKDKVEFDESQLSGGQTYEDVFNQAKTVGDTFDFIEELMGQDIASLEVKYNSEYGYPESILIDYIADAIDDEVSYWYTDFTADN